MRCGFSGTVAGDEMRVLSGGETVGEDEMRGLRHDGGGRDADSEWWGDGRGGLDAVPGRKERRVGEEGGWGYLGKIQ